MKEVVIKDHISLGLHESIHINCPEEENLEKQKADLWLLRAGGG